MPEENAAIIATSTACQAQQEGGLEQPDQVEIVPGQVEIVGQPGQEEITEQSGDYSPIPLRQHVDQEQQRTWYEALDAERETKPAEEQTIAASGKAAMVERTSGKQVYPEQTTIYDEWERRRCDVKNGQGHETSDRATKEIDLTGAPSKSSAQRPTHQSSSNRAPRIDSTWLSGDPFGYKKRTSAGKRDASKQARRKSPVFAPPATTPVNYHQPTSSGAPGGMTPAPTWYDHHHQYRGATHTSDWESFVMWHVRNSEYRTATHIEDRLRSSQDSIMEKLTAVHNYSRKANRVHNQNHKILEKDFISIEQAVQILAKSMKQIKESLNKEEVTQCEEKKTSLLLKAHAMRVSQIEGSAGTTHNQFSPATEEGMPKWAHDLDTRMSKQLEESFNREADLHLKLQEAQSQANEYRAHLDEVRSQLQEARTKTGMEEQTKNPHSNLVKINVFHEEIRAKLYDSNVLLNKTQSQLGESQSQLQKSRTSLKETQSQLVETRESLQQHQRYLGETIKLLEESRVHYNEATAHLHDIKLSREDMQMRIKHSHSFEDSVPVVSPAAATQTRPEIEPTIRVEETRSLINKIRLSLEKNRSSTKRKSTENQRRASTISPTPAQDYSVPIAMDGLEDLAVVENMPRASKRRKLRLLFESDSDDCDGLPEGSIVTHSEEETNINVAAHDERANTTTSGRE